MVEEFRAAMANSGIVWRGEVHADGRLHRFKPEGDKTDCGWYILFSDGPIPAGSYGCWKRGVSEKWKAQGRSPNGKELAVLQRQWKDAEEKRHRDEVERHKRMAERAAERCKSLAPAEGHLYLMTKEVRPHGAMGQDADQNLVLPLTDAEGKVWSLETIDSLGDKLFMPGGRVEGCFYRLAEIPDTPLVVCEGYATGATIHEATGWSVCCAMNCGNMMEVCRSLRKKEPDRPMVVAADNDRFTLDHNGKQKNAGVEKATAAAAAIKAALVIPQFYNGSQGTDFNDIRDHKIVRRVFAEAIEVGLGHRVTVEELLQFVPAEDPNQVLGNRWLCRGGSCLIVGQTHVGKSSLMMQMAIHWALAGDFFGLGSDRQLRSVMVQAENDDGDSAEMFQGILRGTGLVKPGHDEHNNYIALKLRENLVVFRDQTHVGRSFGPYAEKLIQLYKPDLFWIDPLLSFYGDDINDQRAMSRFLREMLNPISERTGVIWMVGHHTGKPNREQQKSMKGWLARDFAYTGIGSSELSNWARAIIALTHTGEDEFRVVFAKRGGRAQLKDEKGSPALELYLKHASEGICWQRIPKPDDKKTDSQLMEFLNTIPARPFTSAEIVKRAERFFQRSSRTCWRLWDGGMGPLGSQFTRQGDEWVRSGQSSLPYKD